ncbi:MAG: T9SS type A sorting domain-containing protein [Chitinophagales bacterium]
MKLNVQISTALFSQFLVFSLCLFLSMNTFAQKPQLSSTMETGGKSAQNQEEEETTNTLETPTLIQSSSQAVQKQQKSGSEEITLNGPFCNGCDDPKGGSSLACSGGNNFIIQGIDISSRTRKFFVNSIDFNQESFDNAPNVRVRLFCGTVGTVHHSATHTALYTETFTTQKSDDGKCVTFELSTPPTIDPACGTTLWIEFRTTSGYRVVSTPKNCNGSTATGNLTYIRAPGCSIDTPKKAKNVGFKLDASFAINITDVFEIKGNIEYCASEEKTTLDAAEDWTNYLWSNGATTQTMDVIDGTYAVTVTDIAGGTATDEVTVIQHANPVPVITGELEYCAADLSTTLDAGKWESYEWNHNQTSQDIEAMAGTHMVIVTDDNGCTGTDEVEVVEYSVPHINMEGTEMVSANNGTGNRVYVVEVCGGKTSYDYDFTSSDGFASISEQPSENTNCRNYQIVYGVGVIWTLTVTDLDICEDKPVTFTNEGLVTNPEIAETIMSPETCIGDEDGSIEIEVEGGDNSCEEYTYTWTGPNDFSETTLDDATGSMVEYLASGMYDVLVTDCAGNTIIQSGIHVSRTNGGSGRGRGRGGCKTAGDNVNDFASLKAFPNPFSQITSIEFSIAETSKVWIAIYSIEGRKVAEILAGEIIEANTSQRLGFDAEKLQNGVYVLELQTESGLHQHQQLMVVK